MRLTRSHVQFWLAKKSPKPGWFDKAQGRHSTPVAPSIHALISAHAGIHDRDTDRDPSHVIANTLSIIRMSRKRGVSVEQKLYEMSVYPGTVIRPERRAASCKKWLRRVMGGSKHGRD